ncbi:FMN-linked oxidoreductase [Favolaschia claudopus]|uniref:FMN-linked oxidoreductase n=1 Tax=Favolaschia claudopus TaxID=2862362 RepID=A0AAV9ZC30_9AGAR
MHLSNHNVCHGLFVQSLPAYQGRQAVKHQVVLAPMTRLRADANHRVRRPGTLLLTHATIIAARAGGATHAPGSIHKTSLLHGDSVPQVTDAVHGKPSFIFSKEVALGRLTDMDVPPHPLTVPEIKEYVDLFANNAIKAGFDAANGYLIHRFLHDEYGGSTLPPRNRWRHGNDPIPTSSYVISQLAQCHPDLAYLHLVEPPITLLAHTCHESNERPCAAWASRRLVQAGGYTRQTALETAEESMLQPDLVTRIEKDIVYTPYDRLT